MAWFATQLWFLDGLKLFCSSQVDSVRADQSLWGFLWLCALLSLQGVPCHLHTALVSLGTAGWLPATKLIWGNIPGAKGHGRDICDPHPWAEGSLPLSRVPKPWPVPTPVKKHPKGTLWSVWRAVPFSAAHAEVAECVLFIWRLSGVVLGCLRQQGQLSAVFSSAGKH